MVWSPAITSMVAERLCGSMPTTTRSDVELDVSSVPDPRGVELGGQRYVELSKLLLSRR